MVAERGVDAHAVDSRRAAWRIIARVEQKDAQQATYEREYVWRMVLSCRKDTCQIH